MSVAADPRVRPAVDAADRAAEPDCNSQALDQIDELQALVLRADLPAGRRVTVDRPRAQAGSCRAFLSIRPALRIDSIRTAAASRSRRPPASTRCPISSVRSDEHRHSRACLPRAPRPGGWQLPQRLHPSPAVACVGRQSRLALPIVRLRTRLGRQHPGGQLRHARRTLPLVQGSPISLRYPIVELADHGCVRAALPCVRRRPDSRSAAGVRVRDDRALRDRPRAPSAPERDHASGHRRRVSCSRCCFRPGPAASLLGILVGGGSLWLIGEAYYRYAGQEGMGGGDVKMLAMIGAFLGWKLVARHARFLVGRRRAGGRGCDCVPPRGPELRAALRDFPRSCRADRIALRRTDRRLVYRVLCGVGRFRYTSDE